jgi:signal transduction histidine kinase
VLDNLISNAVKYSFNASSSARGEILITSGVTHNEAYIAVQDFGRGISPNEQKRIFEPFYRNPGVVDEQIRGNGLGLSIVQHIVKQHGGRISLESEIGKGSTFTVYLPVAP